MRFKTVTLFFWGFLIASAAIAGEEHRTRIEIAVDDDATGGAKAENVVERLPESVESDVIAIKNIMKLKVIETGNTDADALDLRRSIDAETRERILESMDLDKLSAVATAKQCISTILETTLLETDKSFKRVEYASTGTLTEQTRNPL